VAVLRAATGINSLSSTVRRSAGAARITDEVTDAARNSALQARKTPPRCMSNDYQHRAGDAQARGLVMRIYSKMATAVLTAVLALVLVGGTASASRSFSVVGGGTPARFIGPVGGLTFAGSSGVNIISNTTYHGSIHPLIGKTHGALIGISDRILKANCRTNVGAECVSIGVGTAHFKFLSFTGTLPRITGSLWLILIRLRQEISRGRPNCEYLGEIGGQVGGRAGAAEFTITTLTPVRGNRAELIRAEGEEFFRRCAVSGELVGAFTVSPSITSRLH